MNKNNIIKTLTLITFSLFALNTANATHDYNSEDLNFGSAACPYFDAAMPNYQTN